MSLRKTKTLLCVGLLLRTVVQQGRHVTCMVVGVQKALTDAINTRAGGALQDPHVQAALQKNLTQLHKPEGGNDRQGSSTTSATSARTLSGGAAPQVTPPRPSASSSPTRSTPAVDSGTATGSGAPNERPHRVRSSDLQSPGIVGRWKQRHLTTLGQATAAAAADKNSGRPAARRLNLQRRDAPQVQQHPSSGDSLRQQAVVPTRARADPTARSVRSLAQQLGQGSSPPRRSGPSVSPDPDPSAAPANPIPTPPTRTSASPRQQARVTPKKGSDTGVNFALFSDAGLEQFLSAVHGSPDAT